MRHATKLVVTARPIGPAPSLTEQVTERLRTEIRSGHYAVGQAIPTEQQIGLSFGVSRSVVREAISRLKSDGLVKSRQGLGAFVSSVVGVQGFQIANVGASDLQGIRPILELRMGLEVEAASLAAGRRQVRHLAEMRKALKAMEVSAATGSFDSGAEADLRFHRAICVATKNPHFVAFFDYLRQYLQEAITLARRRSATSPRRAGNAQAEHIAIFDAIEKQDAEAARVAARRHVMNTMKRLLVAGQRAGQS